MAKNPPQKILIYQTKSGAIELKEDLKAETILATQAQIADLFGVERSVVTKHIRNILKGKELDADSVCAKFAHTADDGKIYQVQFYNLDVILSVGYRVSSKKATIFRQWATKTLRQHILKGYTINKSRLSKNYEAFLKAVEEVKKLLPAETSFSAYDTLDLIKLFAGTWFSLDAYDKSDFPVSGAFAFVWFLRQTRLLDTSRMTPEALTALTLLIAESNPKEKERMTGLVLLLLQKRMRV